MIQVYNLALGYEKGPFSFRAAPNYRGKSLHELEDPENADFDRYEDDHMQVDLTARYDVTDHVTVFGKLQNLNRRPQYFYFMNPGFNAQYDRIDRTANLGVTASFQRVTARLAPETRPGDDLGLRVPHLQVLQD